MSGHRGRHRHDPAVPLLWLCAPRAPPVPRHLEIDTRVVFMNSRFLASERKMPAHWSVKPRCGPRRRCTVLACGTSEPSGGSSSALRFDMAPEQRRGRESRRRAGQPGGARQGALLPSRLTAGVAEEEEGSPVAADRRPQATPSNCGGVPQPMNLLFSRPLSADVGRSTHHTCRVRSAQRA